MINKDDDWDIPSSHASTLFDAFLSPYLLPSISISHQTNNNTLQKDNNNIRVYKRSDIVSTILIDGYGIHEETNLDFSKLEEEEEEEGFKERRKIALLRTEDGGHDIGKLEGVQDTVGRMFGFY